MKIKFCPRCRESDLIPYGGGVMGIWQCKNCGFMGAVFPEKNVRRRKHAKKNKNSGSWNK